MNDDVHDRDLARALRTQYGRGVPVPPDRDDAMRRAIVRRFDDAGQARSSARRLARLVAAAAAIAIVGVVSWRFAGLGLGAGSSGGAGPRSAQLAGDIDGDGRTDIVDALALALRISAAGDRVDHLERSGDINGDGAVTSQDVIRLARDAVALGVGG